MTVAELIEHLRQYPADLSILVEGYETGWDSIYALQQATVTLRAHADDWDGQYEELGKLVDAHAGASAHQAVLIVGKRGHRRFNSRDCACP